MQNERKYFAASNTEKGFVSYFEEIFGENEKIYIIKGGPGTGKSHLMREIADRAVSENYTVEFFYCSSDPLSLDGIIIDELKVAIIDGTSPHTYEPTLPGRKEEIINLGDNWNKDILLKNKKRISDICDMKKNLYNNIYNYLSAAGRIDSELKIMNRRAVKSEKLKGAVNRLTKGWKNGKGYREVKRPIECISGMGNIIYDTYFKLAENKYVIRDRYNVGTIFIDYIIKKAEQNNLTCVYSPYYLSPNYKNAVLIPEVSCAFIIGNYDNDNIHRINMDRFIDVDILRRNKQKYRFARRCLDSLYEGVEQGFNEITFLHSELEGYYKSAMNFAKNDEIKQRLISEIF